MQEHGLEPDSCSRADRSSFCAGIERPIPDWTRIDPQHRHRRPDDALVELDLVRPSEPGDHHNVLRRQEPRGPFPRLEHGRALLPVPDGGVHADDVELDGDVVGVHFGVPLHAAKGRLLGAVQVVGTFVGSGTALSAVRLAPTVMRAAAPIPITPGRSSRTRRCLSRVLVLRTAMFPGG